MQVHDRPRVVCDSGHNVGAFPQVMAQLKRQRCRTLRIVIGFMADKDVTHLLAMLPRDARYYYTQASTSRSMKAAELAALAKQQGLVGKAFETVEAAYRQALADSAADDFIFVGGSMYVLAEFLPMVNS
jgi:dihydrofolate synthase/folylpolyglutamate synthase